MSLKFASLAKAQSAPSNQIKRLLTAWVITKMAGLSTLGVRYCADIPREVVE